MSHPTLVEVCREWAAEWPGAVESRSYEVHGLRLDLKTPSRLYAQMAEDSFGLVQPLAGTGPSRPMAVWVFPVADLPVRRAGLVVRLGLEGPPAPIHTHCIGLCRHRGVVTVQFSSMIFWVWDRRAGVSLVLWQTGGPTSLSLSVAKSSLTMMLSELVHDQGRCLCHAGAVAWDGRGILVAGGSGSGKSTVTAALWQAGAHLAGDDLCVLDPRPSPACGAAAGRGVSVLGLLEKLHLCRDALGHFPRIRSVLGDLPAGNGKVAVDPRRIEGAGLVTHLVPEVLILPRVDGSSPRMAEIRREDAFLQLAETCRFLPDHLRRPPVKRVLDALLDRTRLFRLHTGPQLDRVAEVVHDACL